MIKFNIENPPLLIVIVGPCRTGTTALANVFAKAGITVYMQPIKSARRAEECGDKVNSCIIKEEDFALIKETLGANTEAEFFNPVEILLDLGYPKEKLVLIPMVRNPEKTLASWREMWSNLDVSQFVRSYKLILDIKKHAEALGIGTIPFVHEATQKNSPEAVIKGLFDKVGLEKRLSKDITNWQAGPKFNEENVKTSRLKFFDVPPDQFIKEVKNWGEYKYREEPYLKLSQSDAYFLSKGRTTEKIYEEFRRGCEGSLGIKV